MAKGGPDLKRYMDKTLSLKLNGNRTVKVRIWCGDTVAASVFEASTAPGASVCFRESKHAELLQFGVTCDLTSPVDLGYSAIYVLLFFGVTQRYL